MAEAQDLIETHDAETSTLGHLQGEEQQKVAPRFVMGILVALIVLGVVGVAGSALLQGRLDKGTVYVDAAPKVGHPAPQFTLQAVGTTEQLSLRSLLGRPVWINFWATWCPPCREEMPDMQRLYEQHRELGLEIVAINVHESTASVSSFTQELGLTFPTVLDRDGKVTDLYFVSSIPTHYFIDRKGIIQAIHMGGLSASDGKRTPVDEYLGKILSP